MSDSRLSSRRDFLRGKAAAKSLQGTLEDSFAPLSSPAGAYLINLSRRAMACDFEIQLAAVQKETAIERALQSLDLVEALEDQMTVYRNDSELVRINQQAAAGPVKVEPRLFSLLQQAQQWYRDTEGALDITAGPLSQVWGFSRREGRLPEERELADALDRVGFHHVLLDESDHTVTFLRPDIEMNLNSIGKGYALDREAELLTENGVDDFLLHGGQSSVWAQGNWPGKTNPEDATPGWQIGLRHPLYPEERLAQFSLHNQALATSGSATQFFRHQGQRYGHLLDPRTGWPAEKIYSATVIAPSAAEADALSTAFYVMGPKQVGAFCASRPDIQAVLVCPTDCEGEVRLLKFGAEEKDP